MKSVRKLSFLFLVLILGLYACRENLDILKIEDQVPDPDLIERFTPIVENVNASVTGSIVDENGVEVQGATITLNNQVVSSDKLGRFLIENKTMNARGAVLKVEKEGYFPGIRRFFPLADQLNNVQIELIPKVFDKSFSAQNGGEITLDNGTSLEVSPNSILLPNGETYQGDVQVALTWLDPTAARTLDQMPGDLQGVSLQNEEVALQTYGMIALEMKSPEGEILEVKEGALATLTIPLPKELLSIAPAVIPFWSFNDEYGIWVQDTTATLQNGGFVVQVNPSTSTFWNVDVPMDLIKVQFQLQDENRDTLSGYHILFKFNDRFVTTGYTNAEGMFSGLIPRNALLALEVLNVCDEVIYTQELGPYASDIDLGVIRMIDPLVETTVISGELIGCEGEPLENVVVLAEFDGHTIYQYSDQSAFKLTFSTCINTQEIKLKVVDTDNFKESEVISLTPGTHNDLGTIPICNQELSNYIKVTVDGIAKIYFAEGFVLSSGNNSTTYIQSISLEDTTSNNNYYYVGLGFSGTEVGEYSGQDGIGFLQGFYDGARGWSLTGNFSTFTVTEYGDVGQPIKGVFEGQLINSFYNNSISVQVTGEFSVIRRE